MKKSLTLSLAALSVLSFSLVGCGGSSSDDPVVADSTNTGTFVDVPTKNLKYVTPTITGYTDENGKYKYKDGEKVKFYLGDVFLGEVDGGELITPFKLAGDTNISNPSNKSKKIARILQSLDTNQSDQDRILLPDSVKNMTTNIDIDNATEADLNAILQAAGSQNSLVDEANATSKMKVYVKNVLETPQNKITLELLKQNPWYVIEYTSNDTYCNGKFTYTDDDLKVEYIENGNNVAQTLRYTLLNGKLISVHDGKVETEIMTSSTSTYVDINKTAIDAIDGSFRNNMSKRWFINRQDALDFANDRGKDCSTEF